MITVRALIKPITPVMTLTEIITVKLMKPATPIVPTNTITTTEYNKNTNETNDTIGDTNSNDSIEICDTKDT